MPSCSTFTPVLAASLNYPRPATSPPKPSLCSTPASNVVDAVKQLCVAPDIMERLHATWVRLRSQMIRSVEAGSEITKLLVGWNDRFLRTEADVVAALQKLIHDKSIRHCSECRREMAAYARSGRASPLLVSISSRAGPKVVRYTSFRKISAPVFCALNW